MDKVKRLDIENGYYLFKLEQLICNMQISKNKLSRETNTDFKVLQRLMNGDMVRIDIIVLARICNYLKCNISDIVEYRRGDKQ